MVDREPPDIRDACPNGRARSDPGDRGYAPPMSEPAATPEPSGDAEHALGQIVADLGAEHAALDAVVSSIDETAWGTATASPGWRIAEQIAHLAYFDSTAALALDDSEGFVAHRQTAFAERGVDPSVAAAGLAPDELLAHWRSARAALLSAATSAEPGSRIEWYGPSMGVVSFLTARLMECWAHGVDVTDALGLDPCDSDRLRHVAHLGFITREWTYANRREEMPPAPVRVELSAPSGELWRHGPDDAAESIVGPGIDFALVTTQRRNIADTRLRVEGDAARDWMSKAQLFAGRPSDPPAPSGSPT